jgi:hypothetical protein
MVSDIHVIQAQIIPGQDNLLSVYGWCSAGFICSHEYAPCINCCGCPFLERTTIVSQSWPY